MLLTIRRAICALILTGLSVSALASDGLDPSDPWLEDLRRLRRHRESTCRPWYSPVPASESEVERQKFLILETALGVIFPRRITTHGASGPLEDKPTSVRFPEPYDGLGIFLFSGS